MNTSSPALDRVHLRDVEIRHLQALRAVAEEGSFGRAAGKLGFTQSAISQQIGAFERILGAALFDRPGGPRAVELTPLGATMLTHACTVLGALELAEHDVNRLLAGEVGRLTAGTFQSVSVHLLPPVVAALRAEQPSLDLRCVEANTNEELLAQLAAGALDLCFTANYGGDPDVEVVHLFDDPFVVLSPAGSSPLPLPLTSLGGMPLVGEQATLGGYTNTCQAMIESVMRTHDIEPNFVFRSNDNSAIQAMVRTGIGHAVLPRLAVDASDKGVVVRSTTPPMPPRRIGIARRRSRTHHPASDRFIAITAELCRPLDARF